MQLSDEKKGERGRFISWICTPFYVVVFISLLVVFHLLQMIAALFGRGAQKHALDLMNICIVWNIRILAGARFSYIGQPTLPSDRSIIIVSNHQSMYDIPMMMWACRSREVGFIAKRELGRWIPSISLALRTLGSVLIDRKDAKASLRAIGEFGEMKERAHQVAAIFPEGTRARDGKMKQFRPSGFLTLLRTMPSALIQPVAIRGNWRILRYNFCPIPFGTTIEMEFLEPVEPNGRPPEEVLAEVEGRIRASVGDDS
jgi:1-acyl-sn-glycerol-3-phosphate acyltransferase